MNHILVFLFWGPISIFNDRHPKGFRRWALFLITLAAVGIWLAMHPNGELVDGKQYVVIWFAGISYLATGVLYLWTQHPIKTP